MSDETLVKFGSPTLAGLKTGNIFTCEYNDLKELIRRLRGRKAFPHEIGLFLSYPPEDVRGFIRYGGSRSKLTGCWQVYGDVENARRTFERFERCTRIYCRRWSEGVPLTRLAVAGAK